MAYRLKADEAVPEGIRRIVAEEIESATQLLGGASGGQRDEAIHEARKSVKKIRGVLRLMRPELGKTYKKENASFRGIGQQLSELRDAAALLEVFDQLDKKSSGAIEKKALSGIKRGLEDQKRETEQRLQPDKVIRETIRTLTSAAQRSATWPLSKDGFDGITRGLELSYREGRRALKRAEKREDPVLYHNLRKRVKDHWYHVRLLENLWTDVMQAHESSLKDLETWLGDDHNLAVLRTKVEESPQNFGDQSGIDAFLALAAQHEQELRSNSIALAHRVYAEKPRLFVRNLSQLWKAWREEPAPPKPSGKAAKREPKQSGRAGNKRARRDAA